MKSAKSPSEKLRRFICDQINNPAMSGTRLPRRTVLARQWNLSRKTVNTVLRPFVRGGDIVAIPGKGSFFRSLPESSEEPSPKEETSTESLVSALRTQIFSGELVTGNVLPQVKYMQLQYGVGQATVSNAYRILHRQGYIHRIGRRYRVGPFTTRGRSIRKAVIVTSDPNLFHRGTYAGAWQAMERELSFHHVWCECESVEEFRRSATGENEAIAVSGVTENNYHEILKIVRRHVLHPHASPSPVLMFGGDVRHEGTLPRYVHYLCHGSFIKEVVRKLCAFVLDSRRLGVAFFHNAGRSDMSRFRTALRIVPELDRLNPDISVAIDIVPPAACSRVEDFLALDGSYHNGGFRYFTKLLNRYRSIPFESFVQTCTLSRDTPQRFHSHAHLPLWIFTDDTSAIEALRWCRSNRKKVPDQIALLSLEGSPGSYFHGLSSCIPDYQTAGYLMAHALLGDMPLARSRGGYMDAPAALTHRTTTIPR